MTRIARAAAVLLLVSCGGSDTTVRLAIEYDDAWELNEFEISANGQIAHVNAAHEVLVWVSDAWAEQDITVEVAGFRDGQRYAFGRVDVTPVLGTEVRATVALSRLPCGEWCTAGSMACESDGVVVCEEQDGCMRWSTRVACPSAAPFCSLGVCDTRCIDECAAGERRCTGPGGSQVCGQGDSDTCLEWLASTACNEGESCSFGSCTSVCRNECEDGVVRCQDGGLSRCADRDFDGCTEWGPSEACANGQSCESGTCIPIGACTDACTANQCNDTTLTRCGNFDLDPCLESSPGSSCVPADPCMEGRCTLSGCESTPRVCEEPPASFCLDDSTLRVYDASGTCAAGTCDYTFRDQDCPGCPSCDRCAGVTCNSAPAPTCATPTTLRTFDAPGTCADGTCTYPHTDTNCAGGCESGACVPVCSPLSCSEPSKVCNTAIASASYDQCIPDYVALPEACTASASIGTGRQTGAPVIWRVQFFQDQNCSVNQRGYQLSLDYFDPTGNGPREASLGVIMRADFGFTNPLNLVAGASFAFENADGTSGRLFMFPCVNADPVPDSVAIRLVDDAGLMSNTVCLPIQP